MQSLRELGAPIPEDSQNTPPLQIFCYAPAVWGFPFWFEGFVSQVKFSDKKYSTKQSSKKSKKWNLPKFASERDIKVLIFWVGNPAKH